MAKISDQTIHRILALYHETPIYTHVAKIVGVSPSTVKKYVQINKEDAIGKAAYEKLGLIQYFEPRIKPLPVAAEDLKLPETIEDWTKVSEIEEAELKVHWAEKGI